MSSSEGWGVLYKQNDESFLNELGDDYDLLTGDIEDSNAIIAMIAGVRAQKMHPTILMMTVKAKSID